MEGTLPHAAYRPDDHRYTKRLSIPTSVRQKAGSSDRQSGETVLIGVLSGIPSRRKIAFSSEPQLPSEPDAWPEKFGLSN